MSTEFQKDTHSIVVGYALWVFGFMGAHRFYYGRPAIGTLYFFTFGLLGIGWFVDLFLIPGMDKKADMKYTPGRLNYNVAWLLLTFVGYFGIHRFYLGRWISGAIYLCTGGIFFLGVLYDFWKLNEMVSEENTKPILA